MFILPCIHPSLKARARNLPYTHYMCIDFYINQAMAWWEVCFAIVGAMRTEDILYKAGIHFFLKVKTETVSQLEEGG